MQVLTSQPSVLQLSVVPGAHTPSPLQALQADQAPHAQLLEQTRFLVWVPQLPHGWLSDSSLPALQTGVPPPEVWHWPEMQMPLPPQPLSKAEQSLAAPLHWPDAHRSPVVHGSPSSQLVPAGLGLAAQPAAPHTPMVHTPSHALQSTGLPEIHLPDWHLSPVVQASPSSQGKLFCVDQPVGFCSGLQTWQASTGFLLPAVKHLPSIKQAFCGHEHDRPSSTSPSQSSSSVLQVSAAGVGASQGPRPALVQTRLPLHCPFRLPLVHEVAAPAAIAAAEQLQDPEAGRHWGAEPPPVAEVAWMQALPAGQPPPGAHGCAQ